jgi:hypothetical protein
MMEMREGVAMLRPDAVERTMADMTCRAQRAEWKAAADMVETIAVDTEEPVAASVKNATTLGADMATPVLVVGTETRALEVDMEIRVLAVDMETRVLVLEMAIRGVVTFPLPLAVAKAEA